jgi:membrane protein insertase Oxa1/YidC/SpoIIIJ
MNSDSDQLDPQSYPKTNALAPIAENENEKEKSPGKRALGEIFSRAYKIYRDNPLMILPSLIPIAVLIVVFLIFAGYIGLIAVFGDEGSSAFSALEGIFLFIILMIVLFFLAEGMTIEMIKVASTGNKANLSNAWKATTAKMEPLVITSLLAGIIVALGYLLFFIPGVILSFAFYFVIQTVMIDGKSGTEALKASYRFVEANLSDSLVIFLVSLGISAVLPSIPFIGAIISVLSLPYVYGLATLLYLDGKEVQEDFQKVPKTAAEVS